MSFGGPLPTLTSPVKVDHVFLLCFCLNLQNWTLERFGKSCFSAFKSLLLSPFFTLFHRPCGVYYQVRCLLSFLPPSPPTVSSSSFPPSSHSFSPSLLFLLSVTCIPHLVLLLFLPLLTSFFLTSLHSLPFHHSFHPFLSLPDHSLPSLFRQTRLRMSIGVPVWRSDDLFW